VNDNRQRPEDDAWAGLSVEERYRTSVGGSSQRAARPADVMGPFRNRLILSDIVVVTLAMLFGLLISSRQSAWGIDPLLAIYGVPPVIAALWIGFLFLRGSYDQRVIGLGTEEIGRAVSATLWTFAVVAGLSYLVRADISRAYAFLSLPLGLLGIVIVRFAWRNWLYRARARGRFMLRTVVVGSESAAEALAEKLTQDSYAGYEVVARIGLPAPDPGALVGWLDRLDREIATTAAAAVAIDPGEDDPHDAIRQLAWRLEGRGIDLLISPGMLDVAGPRLSVRPASGLPLLHLDEAALSRPQRLSKRILDLVGSAVAIVVFSPVMFTCAIWVKATSPGPVIFMQKRVGRWGEPFTMLKFRTMRDDAEALKDDLREEHDLDDPMFKLKDDPRITKAGTFLRRWSLDELPQLFNVLGGSMSLVGPRPHPLDDVNRYGLEAYRRLALKPGLTGLWQVEGRSDLDWAQALQLDLYYVERWSLSGDVILLARTVRAVVQGRGAH
jgi:exopolysaccharide biosynthesis polyprenyl glycosylphosphotransferase